LGQFHKEVERLLEVLQNEGLVAEVLDDKAKGMDIGVEPPGDDIPVKVLQGTNKMSQLGVYLAMQQNMVF
jgi:hypothetical protein